jgi:uncharacterized protein (TIGR00375 family)
MKVISDFHIHSRFSRATSKQLNVANLTKYAKVKGIDLLGTGDFTHAEWLKELKEQLKEDGSGFLRDGSGFPFLLTGEISSIYKDGGRVRRIHNILLSPSIEVSEQINDALEKRGVNLKSDGRPICGVNCPELVEIIKGVDARAEVIPAHIWTPWFSLFGSMSGFDTVEECFKDQTKHIFALETGLSSDPAMNWRLSQLDRYALVSNSDSHSFWPWRIGREANVFEMGRVTYDEFIRILKEKDPKRFLMTIEVDPSYGKYHFDGHRACDVCMEPKDSIKVRNICPKCGRQMTIGVLHRVEELADRPEGFQPKNAIPFKSLIPLSEIISSMTGVNQLYSKKVWEYHTKLMNVFGTEFNVLLDARTDRLSEAVGEKMADAIVGIREGKIKINPGYDGVYGYPVFDGQAPKKISVPATTSADKKMPLNKQKSLSDFGA